MPSRRWVIAGLAALGAAGSAWAQSAKQAAGWQTLFNGTDLTGWRGYKQTSAPSAWRVEDGAIALGTGGARGDIVSADEYDDFELEIDWRIAAGGNSGIFYFVQEAQGADQTYATGLEMQVLDDARHADGKLPSHRAGALYDLIAPSAAAARPVGEWNKARVVVRRGRIEHWLNGRRVIATPYGDAGWRTLIAGSKFKAMPAFAKVPRGRIALQDHGDRVWFRNVRIRRL